MGEEGGRGRRRGEEEGRRSSANRKWRLMFKQAVVWIPSSVCVIFVLLDVCVCVLPLKGPSLQCFYPQSSAGDGTEPSLPRG